MECDSGQITVGGLVKPARTKAFSYLRVSGITQAKGDGIDRQREKIQEYAERNGFEIVQEFRDEGVSGTTEKVDRPGLTDLVDSFNGVKVVLIERADRLARDLMVGEILLKEFREKGWKVISVDAGQDLVLGEDEDPTKMLIRHILGALAQWEKTALVRKLRAGRMRKQKATGRRCGGTMAYGEKDGEAAVVAKIVEFRKNGMSRQEIANQLNAEGIKPRVGEKWHLTTIFRILRQNAESVNVAA